MFALHLFLYVLACAFLMALAINLLPKLRATRFGKDPRWVIILSFGLGSGLAFAEALNPQYLPSFFPNGAYFGKYAPTTGAGTGSSKLTSSYSNGPSGAAGTTMGGLVYQFPAVNTGVCEDSSALVFDAGNGGVTVISFGDVLVGGMDQVLGQTDAGALVQPYVFAANTVKWRYCNFTGNSQGLPDASYYFRSFSGTNK